MSDLANAPRAPRLPAPRRLWARLRAGGLFAFLGLFGTAVWAQGATSISLGATGKADPIQYFVEAASKSSDPQLKSAADFVKAFSGLLVIKNTQGPELKKGQLFRVAGEVDLKAVGDAAASAAAASASTARDRVARALGGLGNLGRSLGVSTGIPFELALTEANATVDLALAFTVADRFTITPPLMRPVNTRLAMHKFNLILKASKGLAGAPSVNAEVAGSLYAQLTERDPWVSLGPSLAINNSGDISFGGSVSGACNATPNESTSGCQKEWDVLGMGLVRSKGGQLVLTVAGSVIKGVQASIQGGKLGPSEGLLVDGAVLVDTDFSPGGGLVLKTTGKPTLKDLMAAVNPLGYGLATLAGIASKMPNANLPMSGSAEVVVAPTGLQLAHIHIPQSKPTFRYAVSGTLEGAVTVGINAEVTADVAKLLAGDKSALPQGSIGYSIGFQTETVLICSGVCPSGFKSGLGYCSRPTYDRGVGKPVDSCAPDEVKDAGLCYRKCPANTRGVGPLCWPT